MTTSMTALQAFHEAHQQRRKRLLMPMSRQSIARPYLTPTKAELPMASAKAPVVEVEVPKPQRPEAAPFSITDLFPKVPQTVFYIIDRCAVLKGTSSELVVSHLRTHEVMAARHLAIWTVLTTVRSASLTWVGNHFCRDHSSVLHAFRRIDGRRQEFEQDIVAIGAAIDVPHLLTLKRDTSNLRGQNQYTQKP
jgi:hypothetical protein